MIVSTKILIALTVLMFSSFTLVNSVYGATYYVAPNKNLNGTNDTQGNDSNPGTQSQPWMTIQASVNKLNPGDTLFLLDGIYHQTLLLDKNIKNGTETNYITVKALNDGQAVIDGDTNGDHIGDILTVDIAATTAYYNIEGIVGQNSSGHAYKINGNHINLRRVSAYNGEKDSNFHVFNMGTANNILLEDCIAMGSGRKMILSWGGGNNIIRRCFASQQKYLQRNFCGSGEWPWGENLEFYNSSNNLMENSISYGSAPNTAVSVLGNTNSANGANPYSRNNKLLGVMAIRNGVHPDGGIVQWSQSTRPGPTSCTGVSPIKQWSSFRDGFGLNTYGATSDISDLLYQDIFSWGHGSYGMRVSNAGTVSNITIDHATIVGNFRDPDLSGEGGVGTDINIGEFNTISGLTMTNSRVGRPYDPVSKTHNINLYTGSGARLTHQYVDGVLRDGSNGTSALPLWPWPMQDRLLKETGIDITGEMTDILMSEAVSTGTSLKAPVILPKLHPGDVSQNIRGVTYTGPVSVSMTPQNSGTQIRYTTDGSEPNSSSALYNAPFTITKTTMVKAREFSGSTGGHTRSAYYVIDTSVSNTPPIIEEAGAYPFNSKYIEVILPNNKIKLYTEYVDFTSTGGSPDLTHTWSIVGGNTQNISIDKPTAREPILTITQPGTYNVRLTVSDGQLSSTSDITIKVWPADLQGVIHSIPGRIEAENYKSGGEGTGYHVISENYGNDYRKGFGHTFAFNEIYGYALAYFNVGEWVAYDVSIPQSRQYFLHVRLASGSGSNTAGGTFHFELDGTDITGPIVAPYTSNDQRKYTNITIQTPVLPAGNHVLRIIADKNAGTLTNLATSINYFEFSNLSNPTPTVTLTATPTPTPTGPVQPCPLAGDTNTCDGVVNILDFSFLSSKFGLIEPKADLQPDGVINVLDYQILANNFGK